MLTSSRMFYAALLFASYSIGVLLVYRTCSAGIFFFLFSLFANMFESHQIILCNEEKRGKKRKKEKKKEKKEKYRTSSVYSSHSNKPTRNTSTLSSNYQKSLRACILDWRQGPIWSIRIQTNFVRKLSSRSLIIFLFLATEDTSQPSEDSLERLRNITKMFSVQINEDGEEQQPPLQKVERLVPSDKIKRTFQK